jgi:GntP family gluconate:H+ symporter
MTAVFLYPLICLISGVALVVLLTTKNKVPAFFALILSAFLVGLSLQMPIGLVIVTIKDGFGNILKLLGLIIVLGTTLGMLLEYTGSTAVMAAFILKKTGEKRAAWAMSITGFIVGLPIFCDSGFIVLNGLNKDLAKRAGIPLTTMSVSLATGLYAVHCLAPPHPGSTAAAGLMGADIGRLMIYGALIAIPGMITGNLWARYAGRKYGNPSPEKKNDNNDVIQQGPSVIKAFLPIAVPLLLIGLKSFMMMGTAINAKWIVQLLYLGDPVVALIVGVLLTFNCKKHWTKVELSSVLQDSVEKAGGILVIIGAGGAFGAILAATKIGTHIGDFLNLGYLGLFFPFLLTFIIKTAQGSSTVAIITAASIVLPMLANLGLGTESGKLLCVLSMGAGSMMISHPNDAYFWVVAKFSGLEMRPMLRVYTIATILMGLTSITMVFLLSKII